MRVVVEDDKVRLRAAVQQGACGASHFNMQMPLVDRIADRLYETWYAEAMKKPRFGRRSCGR